MSLAGVTSTALTARAVVDQVLGNRNALGERETVVINIDALANLLLQHAPLKSVGANAGLYASKADLLADLDHDAPFMGWVYDDPIAANRGIYRLVDGAPKTWVYAMPLPYGVVRLTNAGGDANALTANTLLSLAGDMATIGLLPIMADNTGPVTLDLNEAGAKPLLGAIGTPIPPGGLKAGMLVAFIDGGSAYRLLTDTDSIINRQAAEAKAAEAGGYAAAADAARVLAQTARTQAAGDAAAALAAKLDAIAASEVSSVDHWADTKADAVDALDDYAEGDVVGVFTDETAEGGRVLYKVEGGALVPKLDADARIRSMIGLRSRFRANSRSAAAALNLAAVDTVEIDRFSDAAPRERALYVKTDAEPAHSAKFQAADGSWFELAERNPTLRMFGAFGDGAVNESGYPTGAGTDDTAAIEAWLAYCSAKGIVLALPGPGVFVQKGPVSCFIDPTVSPFALKIRGDVVRGTIFAITYSGVDSVAWTGHDAAEPSLRGRRLELEDLSWVVSDSVPDGEGPIIFEKRYCTDLKMNRLQFVHYKGNSALRLSAVYNSDFSDVVVWGAGHDRRWRDTTDVLFKITAGSKTVEASEDHFDAACVGRSLLLRTPNGRVLVTLQSVESATAATATTIAEYDLDFVFGCWEGAIASIDEGATALVFDTPVLDAAIHVGRNVKVLEARAGSAGGALGSTDGVRPLQARIVAVSGDGLTATLDRPASADASGVYVGFSPAVDIFDEDDSETNDLEMSGFHVERFKGIGLFISAAVVLRIPEGKWHGEYNSQETQETSLFHAVFDRCTGYVSGDFEGRADNALGQIYVCDLVSGLEFHNVQGSLVQDMPLIRWDNSASYGLLSLDLPSLNNYVSGRGMATMVSARYAPPDKPAPRITGRVSSYKNSYAGRRFDPVYADLGDFPSPFASLPATVADNTTTGFETIAYGGRPVFRGVHARGVVDAPTPSQASDPLVSFEGYGYSALGNLVRAVAVEAVLNGAPVNDALRSAISFKVMNAAAALIEVIKLTDAGLLPSGDGVQDLGSATQRFRQANIQRARLFPGSGDSPTANGELNFAADAGNRIMRFRWRGSDGTTRHRAEHFSDAQDDIVWIKGSGSPEGVVTAVVGSLYSDKVATGEVALWIKKSGAGNTGWAALAVV